MKPSPGDSQHMDTWCQKAWPVKKKKKAPQTIYVSFKFFTATSSAQCEGCSEFWWVGFWLGSKSLLQRCLALELFFFLHLYMRLFYLSGLIGIERCLEASLSVFSSRSKRLQPDLEQFRLLSCMCLYPDREKAPWEKAGNYLASSLVFGWDRAYSPWFYRVLMVFTLGTAIDTQTLW